MKGEGKGFPRSLVLGLAVVACAVFPSAAGAVSFFRGDVTVGTHPTSVAVGNFNGGAPDLAVANEGSNDVSILLGNGFGQFTATAPVSVGASPSSVAVGRFNEEEAALKPLTLDGREPALEALPAHQLGRLDRPREAVA